MFFSFGRGGSVFWNSVIGALQAVGRSRCQHGVNERLKNLPVDARGVELFGGQIGRGDDRAAGLRIALVSCF